MHGYGRLCNESGELSRETMDMDLVVATDMENEAKVFSALSRLPDNAVREFQQGELQRHAIIRVGDEIVVRDIVVREVDGVPIPFALLWRMKAKTRREKDVGDVLFSETLVCRTRRNSSTRLNLK